MVKLPKTDKIYYPTAEEHSRRPWRDHIDNYLASHLDVRMCQNDFDDLVGDIEHWEKLRNREPISTDKDPYHTEIHKIMTRKNSETGKTEFYSDAVETAKFKAENRANNMMTFHKINIIVNSDRDPNELARAVHKLLRHELDDSFPWWKRILYRLGFYR